MVCNAIITCPLVQLLRGELDLCRLTYCETGEETCVRYQLLQEGKPVPVSLLPNGDFLEQTSSFNS
jgi:hypothetical protein